jgi:hypothetical protein
MIRQEASARRTNVANPGEHRNVIMPEIVYCLNDEDIKPIALHAALSGKNERASALLSDQTIWVTIASIIRQSSGLKRRGVSR